MTIALFASDRIPLSAIATNLRRAGSDVSPFDLIPTLSRQDITPLIAKGVLITSEGGLIEIGEQTEQVRDLIGERLPLILCSPRSTTADREVLMECGASDVITPQSWNAEHVSERVLGQLILNGDITPNGCGTLYGGSTQIRRLYSDIEKLAPLSEPILLLGETGTGKELVARELHNRSGRRDSYIPVNCPELHPDLISSELFGHEKGAFTGASAARIGLIAAAGGGLFFWMRSAISIYSRRRSCCVFWKTERYGGSVLITLRRYGHESSWPQTTTYRRTAARGSFATTSTSISVASLWYCHP